MPLHRLVSRFARTLSVPLEILIANVHAEMCEILVLDATGLQSMLMVRITFAHSTCDPTHK